MVSGVISEKLLDLGKRRSHVDLLSNAFNRSKHIAYVKDNTRKSVHYQKFTPANHF